MATLTDVKSLAVKDTTFRKSLFSNPEDTLRKRSMTLSSRELTTLKQEIETLTSTMSTRELDAFFADTKSALGWSD